MKIGSKKQLDEQFPDRRFTKEELRSLSKEINKAGGREAWLISKGFIKVKNGNWSVVQFEGIIGKEIFAGLRYSSDIPYTFWNSIGFPQLDKYEFGINESNKENMASLENLAKKVVKNKRLL